MGGGGGGCVGVYWSWSVGRPVVGSFYSHCLSHISGFAAGSCERCGIEKQSGSHAFTAVLSGAGGSTLYQGTCERRNSCRMEATVDRGRVRPQQTGHDTKLSNRSRQPVRCFHAPRLNLQRKQGNRSSQCTVPNCF